MAIHYNQEKRIFTLDTANTTYQMKVTELGYLQHLYYGARLSEEDDMSYLYKGYDRGFSGNPDAAETDRTFSLDCLPQEYPTFGVGDYRINCIQVKNADGSAAADFQYESHQVYKGKYEIPGMPAVYGTEAEAETLTLKLTDPVTGLVVTLHYGVFEEQDIITRAVSVKAGEERTVHLEKAYSVCLDLPYGDWDLMHFHGRHAMEREMERTPVMHGVRTIGSRRGTSSHHHNPFIILCDPQAGENFGSCYGLSLVYSGSFQADVEVDQLNQTRVTMGIQSEQFDFALAAGEEFRTPEVVMTYSDQGFTALSSRYHQIYRHNLCRGAYKLKRRPVLINNWEATYFDFDADKLVSIAEDAAQLGVEMLVMDDGWFGKREADNSSLGDWQVNTAKLQGSLRSLSERVNALGVKLGIWFEPEMISEESELYRAHPDWVLQAPGRRPNRSRYQLVLDMSRKEVRDYLYNSIAAVLDSANIEYVKWDMNRSICDVYSEVRPDRQGELSHRYVLGLYDLLERLVTDYPHVLFEGCSGGGGRFDPGMLYYSPQIWCSDDTDAVERLKIQYGTSFGYPISAVGSHVSACPNHQTGRSVSFETRGVVAMAGSFGYELDLNQLSEAEKEIVKQQIADFKRYYDLIQDGTYYRLSNPYENRMVTAWQFVSANQEQALFNAVLVNAEANGRDQRVFLKGLNPRTRYRLSTGEVLSGSALMSGGVRLDRAWDDYQSVQIYIKAVSSRN